MLSVEPPDHTRYRKLVSSVFTTRAVAALRDRVQDTANALLDDLADDAGTVDVVERYCSQLPVTVIGDILGVPDDARPRILEFGELGAASLDIGLTWRQYRQVYPGIEGFNDWLSDHLHAAAPQSRRRSAEPVDSGTSDDRATDSTHEELLATAGLVLAAGFETTVNLLGNGIRMLLDNPEHLETLAARPELWPTAVEEILRLDSPVQLSARMASKDTEIAGTLVRRGEGVIIYLAGANRDPKVFADPHRLRHRTRERGQAPVVLRRQALLPRRGAGARRRRGRVADVLRALPGRAAGRQRQPARHAGAAGMVVAADHAWKGAHRCRFVAWISERRCSTRPGTSGN